MTCPPNAFRTGDALIRLEPGASFTGTWGTPGSSVATEVKDGLSEEVVQTRNLRAPIQAKEHAASATGTRL